MVHGKGQYVARVFDRFVVNGEIMIEIFCCWKIIACGWK